MARYRKIEIRMFRAESFRSLPPGRPSARYLLVFLLTGPMTTNVPGLVLTRRYQLAEELQWSVRGLDQAMAELLKRGLVQVDWDNGVIFVRGALGANSPATPSTAVSWRPTLEEVPDCFLKALLVDALRKIVRELAPSIGDAFEKAFPDERSNTEMIAQATAAIASNSTVDAAVSPRQPFTLDVVDTPKERGAGIGKEVASTMTAVPADTLNCVDKEVQDVAAAVPCLAIVAVSNQASGLEEKKQTPTRKARHDAVLDVFAYYRKYHPRSHPQPRHRSKEWRNIDSRLGEGHTIEELKEAIDGCHESKFHQGVNDNGMRYDSLELITRDGSHVQQFVEIHRGGKHQARQSSMSPQNQRTVLAVQEWLSGTKESTDAS